MVKATRWLQKALIGLIALYRYCLSPFLGQHCRFYPSCSVYAQTAIAEQGVVKGLFLTLKRILCCQPWHSGGFDPVPGKNNSLNEK